MNTNSAIYTYLLGNIKGIKASDILRVGNSFPDIEALSNASNQLLNEKLGIDLSQKISANLLNMLPVLINKATNTINMHIDKGITPIPIVDANYPALLKLIANPPLIIYAKGNISLLSKTDAVAVVGTRNPTPDGKKIAHQIARYFAQNGFTIISGLAKGIDTAAHVGALDVQGYTIAVLGTALDKIYPAENKPLVDRICSNSGAVISELAIGQGSYKLSFIQRDRIQSGLSLGIIPVQTDIEGGTMHTVKFAEQQKRLIFCPRPRENEINFKQSAGILSLIHSRRAIEFNSNSMDEILKNMLLQKDLLLPSKEKSELQLPKPAVSDIKSELPLTTTSPAEVKEVKPEKPKRNKKRKSSKDNLPLFEENIKPDTLEALQKCVRELGLDSSPNTFDSAFLQLKKKIFPK